MRRHCIWPWLTASMVAWLLAGTAHAVNQVLVLGLFKNAAVIVVDGRQQMLRVGESTADGVRLLEADSERAVLEVDGKAMTLGLGTRIDTDYESPAPPRAVRVLPDADNMYTVTGSVNGFSVRFVLDTGASAVALNGHEARRIGIDFQRLGVAGYADTPAGPVATHRVTLDRVRIGEIELQDVDALIIEGPYPREALLGMSFLGRLQLRQNGRVMELRVPPR